MNSALKLCSITQRLLVLASGILLAFILSAHSRTPYQDALNDILAIGEHGARNMSDFITSQWLVERRSENEILPIYQASNRTLRNFTNVLLGAMEDLGATVDHKNIIENTIFTDSQNQVRLKGWERPDLFLPMPPVEEPTVRRMLHYLERDELRGTIIVLPSYEIWFTPHIKYALRKRELELAELKLVEIELLSEGLGKGRIEAIEKEPGSEMPKGNFRLTFEKLSSNSTPYVELDVEIQMNRTGFYINEKEWAELRRSWYKSNGIDPVRYVSGGTPFDRLRIFESQVGNMTLSEAAGWLRKKASGIVETVNLLGISLGYNLVSIFGPIVLSILMVGIIAAIHHVLSIDGAIRLTYNDVYWGVVSPSRIARVASFGAITFLPGGTCIAMGVYFGNNVTTFVLNSFGILLAIAVFWSARKLISNVAIVTGSETK